DVAAARVREGLVPTLDVRGGDAVMDLDVAEDRRSRWGAQRLGLLNGRLGLAGALGRLRLEARGVESVSVGDEQDAHTVRGEEADLRSAEAVRPAAVGTEIPTDES